MSTIFSKEWLLLLGLAAACADQPLAPKAEAPTTSSAGANMEPMLTQPAAMQAAARALPPMAATKAANPVAAMSPASAASAPAMPAPAVVQAAAGSSGTPSAPATPQAADEAWCGVQDTLRAHCTTCHNPQKTAGAPMSLETYADLIAPAVSDPTKKVYELVTVRMHDEIKPMPPQGKLDDAQLSAIDAWVQAGAPANTAPSCAAEENEPTAEALDAWPEHCDETYTILAHGAGADDPHEIGPGQETHPKFNVPAPWGSQPRQAIAIRAIVDNPKVVHHWILFGPQGEFLYPWAPRKHQIYTIKGEDAGLNLSTGTLTLDVHYNNLQGTSTEQDRSGLEICALKPENFRKNTAAVYPGFTSLTLSIPPRAQDYDVTAECTMAGAQPVTLLTVGPHAHNLARHAKISVRRKTGEVEVLHDKAFNFGEQVNYDLDPPVVLQAGDTVVTTCTYDNDTDRFVTFGENGNDEMCFNFAMYYPMGAISCALGTGTGVF